MMPPPSPAASSVRNDGGAITCRSVSVPSSPRTVRAVSSARTAPGESSMQTTMCEKPTIAGKYMRPVGVWRSAGVGAASLICAMEGSPLHADASVGDHVVWGGHATVRIVLGDAAVLTDPVLRRRVMHLQRVVPLVPGLGTDLRAVLISHLHHDHLDLASLRMLPGAAQIVVPVGARRALGRRTLQRVIELAPGESVDIAGVQVR